MNVIAHGVDMVECDRLQRSIDRHGDRLLQRVFTPDELAYCQKRQRCIEHLSGRFAAKEAVFKVLGTGWARGIAWTDVEVRNAPSGRPSVHLSGRCRELADQLGIVDVLISISHVRTHAIASAIATARESGPAGAAW